MKPSRNKIWLALSLICLTLALVIWHHRGPSQAGSSAPQAAANSGQTPGAATAAATVQTKVVPASTAPFALLTLNQDTNASVATAALKRAERLKYRLSNTAENVGQLTRNPHAVLLENALIDSSRPLDFTIPDSLKSQGDPGTYIVQARGPINDAFRSALRDAGAEIVSYIPNNAFLVRLTAGGARQLSGVAQTVLPFEPYYKLDLGLLKNVLEGRAASPSVNVLVFADARAATLDALGKIGVGVLAESPSPFGTQLVLQNVTDAAALARMPGIQRVETATPRQLANDLTRARIRVSTNSVTTNNYLNLSGRGVTVNMNDSGVDATHPDLLNRMFSRNPLSLFDANGHGTHVAGIIAGDGAMSLTVTNARGSINPGTSFQYRGKAPAANLFVMPINDAFSDFQLQQAAARTNALISNNSWGYGNQGYDIASASYDAAVRDALPEKSGSQPVLFVFSAGNTGNGDDGGVNGNPESIVSPSTAKNVITVGAVELPRGITNEVIKIVAGVTNRSNPWAGQTDSSNQIAGFSARGNVGIGIEGDFGRFKPDVVAPGTFVVSTRSQQWDERAYYNPTNYTIVTYQNQTVTTNDLKLFPSVFVPNNAVRLTIQATGTDPVPVPNLPIYVRLNDVPRTNVFDAFGLNQVSLPPDAPLVNGTVYFFAVGDPTNRPVKFDLTVTVVTTNDLGNQFEVLSNLNNSIGDPDWYRYETGTSMAAPAVSGVLALMQEFFESKQFTNSPALMKALVINGARSVNGIYDLQVQNTINYQGWGMINLTNSLPAAFTNVSTIVSPPTGASLPTLMFDQSPTNALATGDSHTINIKVSSAAKTQPLRVTLVWTDPPGNPAAGVKLVNNLDLVVTNYDDPANPLVYFGNDILAGANSNTEWDTNGLPNLDLVNNVENIYLAPTLGANYSITVIGRSVNVNAVTAHTNGIVQDYALVISSGNGQAATGLQLFQNVGILSPNPTNTTVLTNQFGASNPDIFGQVLGEQRVGANSPLIGTNGVPTATTNGVITLGATNQWHFYYITNSTPFTNALFATSLPIDLAASRMGVTNTLFTDQAARLQADIDLYVSTDPLLLTLDSNAVALASKSLGRGGFEQIVLSNAAPAKVYYIGVKSEDQLAAEFTLTVLFSLFPFNNGDNTYPGYPLPSIIPDGSPALPGAVAVTAYAVAGGNTKVRRVVVTNIITHEDFGDLIGTLTHDGAKPVVLDNHTFGNGNVTQQSVYEDSGANSIPGSKRSDGPGSLAGYIGDAVNGQWSLIMVDNALTHTGRVDGLSIHIDPHVENDLPPGATNGVVLQNCVTVAPGGIEYDFVGVPFNGQSVQICVSNTAPVQLIIRNGSLPTLANFDYTLTVNPTGACFTVSLADLPPLQPGTLFFGLYNPNVSAQDVCYTASLTTSATAVVPIAFASTNGSAIEDDAITHSSIQITNNQLIASAAVGVVLNHPRVSDLTLTLISPGGGRYVLFEDRGGLGSTNLGHLNITTNFFGSTTAGNAAASTNILSPVATAGILLVNYDFYNVPDSMDVYYDGVNIFSTGLISGNGQFQIPYGPGVGTSISIVMNQGGNPNIGTAWVYTPTVVNQDYTYLSFTEDPKLASVPIKFAVPPFDQPGVGTNFNLSDFEMAPRGDYLAPTNVFDGFGGWSLFTNKLVGTNLVSLTNNQVSVVTDPAYAQAGSNLLALALGTINRTVTTTAGKKYTLTYYYRGPGIAGWWRGEGNATDGSDPEVQGNNGALVGRFEFPVGAVGQAFQLEDAGQQFRFAGTNTYVQVRQSIALDVGTGSGMTVEGWINPTNVSFQQPLVEWLAFVPTNGPTYYVQDGITNRSGTNIDIIAGPFLNPATSHYYYLLGTNTWTKSEQVAISLGGHLATLNDANEANWVYDAFSQYGGTNRMLWLGLTNDALGNFNWANGETNLYYTNWAAAQPSNCIGNEKYVAVLSPTNLQAGLWVLANNNGLYCGGPATNRIYGVVEVNEIQTNGVQLWISVTNSTVAGTGRLYADLVDTNNVSHILFSAPGLVQSNVYQHVALTYDTNSGVANLYYNGTNVASTNFGGVVFVPKTGGDLLLGKDMSRITNNFYGGKMDEMSVYKRQLSASEIAAIYRLSAPSTNLNAFTNPVVGKFDPAITPALSLAAARVSLGGITNLILGANRGWQVQGFTFTATTNSLPMQIAGDQPGMLLDSFGLAQAAPGNLYYLPEESLADLVGQNAKGKWTLEIQDARAGNTNTAGDLVSWQMQLLFQNTVPTAVALNPFAVATNIVPAGKTAYFTVDVPTWASYATNILASSTAPVDLLFNQTNPPTGPGVGDFTLLTASIGGVGAPVLVTNGVPPLLPGQRYYLGVKNSGAAAATVAIRVDYDILTLTNSVPVAGFLNTNDAVRYFAFDATSNAVEATFQVLKISSNVDLVVSQGTPLPTLTSTAYGSFNADNADENIYVLTNSAPVPLSGGRWYLGVFKRVAEPASFSVLAKELDPPLPTTIDLANNVPFNYTTGPGAALTNFFRFTVTNSPFSMRFVLYNLSGDGDLTVQSNATPLAPPFLASSQQKGLGVELVVLQTNSFLTNLNAQWYLGVPNHETNSINYTIVASIDTNGYFPAFPGAQGAGGGALGGRFGDVYHVVSLDDSGFGSLRYGVNSATTNRTIVFDVAGTITLLSPLVINKSNLTIAGQTAPGEGITIKGSLTSVENAHDVVIRFVRFRQGANASTNRTDAFHFNFATNVIADHVTASLARDSALSALWSTNVTVQWSMIADNLDRNTDCSTNPPPNGLGSRLRFGDGALSFHHNLYADNSSASPRLGDNLKLDFVNNVVYNWGILPGYSTNDIADNPLGFTNYLNYVGNYLIAGKDTATNMQATAFLGGTINTWISQTNNLIDSNTNGILDGANTQWQMFTNDFVPAFYTRTNLVFQPIALDIDETFLAYEKVLNFAGTATGKRDMVDAGIVAGVRNQSGAAGAPLAGMVAWWKAENNANDSVGGNNGTLMNGAAFSAGEVGNAFNFDGVNDFVLVTASINLDVGSCGGFTIEGWVYPTDLSVNRPVTEFEKILGTFNGSNVAGDFYVSLNGNPGMMYANIVDTTGAGHTMNSVAGVVTTGVWQHVAVSYNQATGVGTLYRNGAIAAQQNLGNFIPQTSFTNFLIGARTTFGSVAAPSDKFAGKIDELGVYNRSLSSTEIAAIFNAGSAGKQSLLPGSANLLPFLDSDQDGAPDFWEITLGENPTNATASLVDRDGDGYTDLEEYLNWQGVPHALTLTNTPVGVDLIHLFGRTGNLSFSVTNGFNGLVYLTNILGPLTNVMGGMTNVIAAVTNTGPYSNSFAIFMPTNSTIGGTNFYGYAGFEVYVTNNATIAHYGPVPVSVLVSAVPVIYAPINTNVPPVFFANPPNLTNNELTLIIVTNAATLANTNLSLSYTVSLTIDTNAMIANGWPLNYANTTNTAPVIDPNGVITWTPSEAQGPGVYIVTTVASDSSIPPLRTSNSFTVTVNEVNLAPFWLPGVPSQTNYTIPAATLLTVLNTASDLDVPPNPLTYILEVSPPATNAVISTNGIISWTPTVAQVGLYTFTTIVTDTNQFAVNAKSLSATNVFTVTVTSVAAPFVFTQPAQAVTGTSAKLNGMVTPNGLPTTAWFQWGTNTTYGNVAPAGNAGNSFNVVYTTNLLSGLLLNVPYHFRLVASNALGITFGFDQILDQANVVAWGANYIGQGSVPLGLSNVVAVAGAYDHSVALKNNGTAVAWGDNTFGQATVPAGLNNLLAVAGGQYYSMALRNNGTVASWGANILAQTNVPAGLNNVVTIAGGTFSSLALKNNGAVVAWGANFFGLTNVPAGLGNIVAIAGGSYHNLAVRNDGTVAAWGDNSANQTNVPAGLTNVVAIAGGSYHNLALLYNGTVAAWGDNSAGQANVPPGLTNVVAIAAGGFHSLALKNDGTVVTWGDNSSGQTSVPVGLNQVVAIASGYFHSLALTPLVLNSTNAILNLTNGIPQTNSIAAGGLTFYRVSVPTNADFATNSLLFTQNGPLNIWFTTNAPPSITNVNDRLLLGAATNGASILSTTSAPTNIIPGAVYYLGVQNTNLSTVLYGIGVDFHLFTVTNAPPTNAIPIAGIVYTNIAGTNGFLLTWFAPSNYLFQVQWSPGLAPASWTPFTNIVSYNTNVFTSPTNTQFNFFDDGTQFPFGPARYYRLVLLPAAIAAPPVLVNGVPVTNAIPPGAVSYFRVNVPTNADYSTNILLFATNSPLNVWFTTNAPPSVTNLNDTLLLSAATNGFSVLSLTNSPRLIPGSFYYLGVQNTNGLAVTYAIRVDFHLVANPPPAINFNSIVATNIGGTNGFLLSWFAPTNAVFQVQWTPTLAPTNYQAFAGVVTYTGPVTSSNGLFTYFDNGVQFPFGPSRYYRVLLLTGNSAPVLPPGGQVYVLNPLATLLVTNTATDLDIPTNTLAYVLFSTVADTNNLPTISTNTGVISWTPSLGQAGSSNVLTTIVTDNGVPPLSATNSFVVIVNPIPAISSITVTTNGLFQLNWFAPTNNYFLVESATNLNPPVVWITNGSFVYPFASNYFRYIDTNGIIGLRFFRLLMFP